MNCIILHYYTFFFFFPVGFAFSSNLLKYLLQSCLNPNEEDNYKTLNEFGTNLMQNLICEEIQHEQFQSPHVEVYQ